jgi:UV DNA damage endonuclease
MIGLCCHYIVPVTKRTGNIIYDNILNEKKLQFNNYNNGKYPRDKVLETYINNISNVKDILKRVHSEGIRSYRMSTSVFPLWDIVPEEIKNDGTVLSILKEAGKFIIDNEMRVTCHPDQFVVLSSDNPNVRVNSLKMLTMHAWVFDQMDLPKTPYYSINIHGGKGGNSKQLIESIMALPDSIRNRLTLENDESSYSVKQLYEVYQATGTAICFDSHHHTFNTDDLASEDAMELAMTTWGAFRPMTHLSNTEPGMESGSFRDRRKHSDYVHYIPEHQRKAHADGRIDIDFEFKMKNLAMFKAVKDFDLCLA